MKTPDASYYFRALSPDTQAALQLRIDAIAACGRREMIESALLYKRARVKLKLACAKGVYQAQYLLGVSYHAGGWGKICNTTKYARFRKTIDDRASKLLHLYTCDYYGPSSDEAADARSKISNGDFTLFEALVIAGGIKGPKEYLQALYDLGSPVELVYADGEPPISHLTGCGNSVLYARVDAAGILKSVCALELSNSDKFILRYLGEVEVITNNRPTLIMSLLTYLRDRLHIPPTAEYKYYFGNIYHIEKMKSSFLPHWNVYHRATVTWLLCGRVLGVCADITRLIGQLVFAGRYDKWLYG